MDTCPAKNNDNAPSSPFTADKIHLHPLLQFLILGKLFEYLEAYNKNLRLVCSIWNNCIYNGWNLTLPILVGNSPSKSMAAFRQLLSSPHTTLKFKDITFSEGIDFSDPDTISTLEDIGDEFRNLKIVRPLNSISALSVIKTCPYLKQLEINPSLIATSEIPLTFQDAWNNSLPRLQSLIIHAPDLSTHNHILADINDNEDYFTIFAPQFQFLAELLRKTSKLEKLQVSNYSGSLWERFSNALTQHPAVLPRLKELNLNFIHLIPRRLNSIFRPRVNLKTLEINRLTTDLSTEDFSSVLEHYAGVLETLKIHHFDDNIPQNDGFDNLGSDFQLNFPCRMIALKSLTVNSLRDYKIRCIAPGNINVFEQLPNLVSFRAKEHEVQGNWDPWKTLFPTQSRSLKNNFVQNELTELDIEWCINASGIVNEIQRHFPELTKLSLNIKSSKVHEVAEIMSESKVEECRIKFYGTEDAIHWLASGITGLAFSDCKLEAFSRRLEKYGTRKGNGNSMRKIRDSFGEWEALRELSFFYVPSSKDVREGKRSLPLTNVCVDHGVSTWRQLSNLTLRNFEVHPQQVSKMLETVSLRVVGSDNSNVKVWDKRERNPRVAIETNHKMQQSQEKVITKAGYILNFFT